MVWLPDQTSLTLSIVLTQWVWWRMTFHIQTGANFLHSRLQLPNILIESLPQFLGQVRTVRSTGSSVASRNLYQIPIHQIDKRFCSGWTFTATTTQLVTTNRCSDHSKPRQTRWSNHFNPVLLSVLLFLDTLSSFKNTSRRFHGMTRAKSITSRTGATP